MFYLQTDYDLVWKEAKCPFVFFTIYGDILYLVLFGGENYNILCGGGNGLYNMRGAAEQWGMTPHRGNYYRTGGRILRRFEDSQCLADSQNSEKAD